MEPLDELLDEAISQAMVRLHMENPQIVRRHAENPHSWDVRLLGEKTCHVVNRIRLGNGIIETYCTCQTEENLHENLPCPHACAVEAVLQHRKETAAARRNRGLTYTGAHTHEEWQVFVREGNHEHPQEYPLDPRPSQELRNHSPDGFSWGYQGSGPAQLALAMLLDYTGDEELSLAHYQEFKRRIIAALPGAGRWAIHPHHIETFLTKVSLGCEPGPLCETTLTEVTQTEAQSPQAEQAPDDAGATLSHDGQLHDEIFPFSGYFGRPAQCRLRWIRRRILGQEKVIVIATEQPTDSGTSVTNRIEHLAGAICRRYRFDPERLILIEHYPSRHYSDQRPAGSKLHDPTMEERFALVSCHREDNTFTHPQWTRVTKKQVEKLLGQTLPESSERPSA